MNFLTFYQKVFSFVLGVVLTIVALAHLYKFIDANSCGETESLAFFAIFALIGTPSLMHGIRSVRELYKRD
jgi:hypothetical protein